MVDHNGCENEKKGNFVMGSIFKRTTTVSENYVNILYTYKSQFQPTIYS